jgi:hypothetical protein
MGTFLKEINLQRAQPLMLPRESSGHAERGIELMRGSSPWDVALPHRQSLEATGQTVSTIELIESALIPPFGVILRNATGCQ